jgi:hypothetical protein
MLKSLDALEKGFENVSEKSRKNCGSKLEEMRQLTFLSGIFFKSFCIYQKKHKRKFGAWGHSLYHACLLELFRTSGSILFLSTNGLYRNAFDDIRHTLESIVQAIYIDSRHPNTPLGTRIEILKEIEDKREYHAVRLIDELRIAHKDKLREEYKELSRVIHPTHEQILVLMHDIKTDEKGIPITVNCEEISNIYKSMKKMYDIFFFLILNNFPELRESMKKDADFIKGVKLYKLGLVAEAIGVKL